MQKRTYTQRKLDNKSYDILKFVNENYKNIFVSIKPVSGRIQFKHKVGSKSIYFKNAIYEISKDRLPNISLTKKSKKIDYEIIDMYGNIKTIEVKSISNDVLSEYCNLTKKESSVNNFKLLCEEYRVDYREIYDNFIENLLKYKYTFLDLVYDRLPDYFIFHDRGKIVNFLTIEDFLEKYELDLVIKPDAGGKREYKFDRPTIIYKKR